MAFLEVRNARERNQLIAAAVLGVLALSALYFAFGGSFFGKSTVAAVKPTPTPRPGSARSQNGDVAMPTAAEQNFYEVTTPIVYIPGNAYAPDAGRNIFAFYEPPPPTPWVPPPPTPIYVPPISPTPTPHMLVGYMNPGTVYAGSKTFTLEVNGDRFTPDARIYFSQSEVPTRFINAQKLTAEIPSNFIAQEGPRQIIVQTPDGTKYSNQIILQIQAPPRPDFEYIGMIARKRYNNDTAYFVNKGKPDPFGARLNDVLGGRFRLVNITAQETTFEDVSLGFKHRVQLTKEPAAGSTFGAGAIGAPGRGVISVPGFQQYIPPQAQPGDIPGIPSNIPRYNPADQQKIDQQKKEEMQKQDVDDDGDSNN